MYYKNIFYVGKIWEIGGTESFLYYLCKKYKMKDIAVVYEIADPIQLNRLKKFVRTIEFKSQRIQCEKAFYNYAPNIIDFIDAKEHIQILHTDYKKVGLTPSFHKKITGYIGVTQYVCDAAKRDFGIDVELCYNPIELDKPRKPLILVSATRLTKEKGKDRMIILANILEANNIPYIWIVFTNDTKAINNENIIYKKPRLDVINYIAKADYLVQLSDDLEGFGYAPAEALSIGVPVIVTDCKAFKEIGIKDGINGYVLNLDMTNVDANKIYNNIPRVAYEPPKDNWSKILEPGDSQYQVLLKTYVKVRCIRDYFDIVLQCFKKKTDEPYEMNIIRAEELEAKKLIQIIKEK